ncbi:YgfZ/GcvT domain-containing protein [Hoeflea sp.]|uniref:CAF17-like 4Fe-4S cluster assembly/insertion protein YgfZ n=1 Tax=Hoeflea sp. TaxID=1940281 RepID=UPI003BB1E4FE
MPALNLTDRVLVSVDGAEAEHFLQNLVTANVEAIEAGHVQPAALLTPQGKILFDFMISRAPEAGFHLDIAAELAGDFQKRLALYKLRAKVTIETLSQTPVIAGWGGSAPEGALIDNRFPKEAGVWRLYGSGALLDAERTEWDAVRVTHGVAESGTDYALSDAFPHDVLMDKNHGVDFRKGCYVGQEVVSRMQHRGTARRRIAIVSAEEPLPGSGTGILAGGKQSGTLGTVAGNRALAIVRTDRIADAMANELPIEIETMPVTVSLPEWTGLSFASDPNSNPDD